VPLLGVFGALAGLMRRGVRCRARDGSRSMLFLLGFFARDHRGDGRVAGIGGRGWRESALFAQILTRGGFVVVLGPAAELVSGETLCRSIVHPAEAREVRDCRPTSTPRLNVRVTRITGLLVVRMTDMRAMRMTGVRVLRIRGRRRGGIGHGVLGECSRVADGERRHHAGRRSGASRTRAFAIGLAYRRKDLKGDPARLATTFVNRHFLNIAAGQVRRVAVVDQLVFGN